MDFAIFGGDARFVRLAELLRADGHRVRAFALPDGCASAAEAAEGAACVILPLPALRDGRVNAPLAAAEPPAADALAAVRPGTLVCAGRADAALRTLCAARGLPLRDYFLREDFTLRNAALTAEAAAALLAERKPAAGRAALVVGFGRVGSRLAARLRADGVDVTVADRSGAVRAAAAQRGFRAVPITGVAGPGYDIVVNTVPFPLFRAQEIAAFGGAELLELASAPYGFDRAAALALGREVTLAPGLPARAFPEEAAAAVRDAVLAVWNEFSAGDPPRRED